MGRFPRTLGPQAAITAAIGLWIAVMVTVSVSASAATRQNGAPAAKAPETPTTTAGPGHRLRRRRDLSDVPRGQEEGLSRQSACARGEPAHAGGEARAARAVTVPARRTSTAEETRRRSRTPATMTLRDANETCLSCHNRSTHDDWAGGKHDARNVSCVTCHSVHAPKSEKAQLKTETHRPRPACSATARKSTRCTSRRTCRSAKERRKMECTTCHNPHGSQNVKMLKEGNSITEACATLPRREARPVPVGARGRARELRHLPRPARVEQRADARRQAADALPALPRPQPAPGDHLRRDAGHQPEQPRRRPRVRELPSDDSRLESSDVRQSVPAVSLRRMRCAPEP